MAKFALLGLRVNPGLTPGRAAASALRGENAASQPVRRETGHTHKRRTRTTNTQQEQPNTRHDKNNTTAHDTTRTTPRVEPSLGELQLLRLVERMQRLNLWQKNRNVRVNSSLLLGMNRYG